ncbi:hypothetical protein [Nocardioides sp. L-11A]|uniref:hypothetical protein n=1 Tax=Nocardioides sp. L-11A TaxID=3043848 RepID=UPI00249B8726|nr:hypothetical protein QJ852_23025 [Nocardioides sp. L-11A]
MGEQEIEHRIAFGRADGSRRMRPRGPAAEHCRERREGGGRPGRLVSILVVRVVARQWLFAYIPPDHFVHLQNRRSAMGWIEGRF